ncbi:GGDEF domain-containing protein [Neptunicella sp. SCSIO 80796]|uniref:GGDEF domain-containing protein n=1 Tax=Neptunicella plasticusilytica TaxID=3117012 RepID=UPI003A4DB366
MKHSKPYNLILVILLSVTCISILLQIFWLKKTLRLHPGNVTNISVITDQSEGGLSTAEMTITDNKWLLQCNITASGYNWPFCEFSIAFFDDISSYIDQGLDLSDFSSVDIKASYLNHPNTSVRFQLRSFNPEYSRMDNEETWKYVGIEYWPHNPLKATQIPMKSLQVATWWVIEQKIPVRHNVPEFDRVMIMELSTGSNLQPGRYEIELEYIQFNGKYFTNSQVLFSLVILWVGAALLVLFGNLRYSRHQLNQTKQKAEELRQLNQLLNVETKLLKDKAERDPLTGALNRTGIQSIFTKELKVLSLIFIDVDHFKSINDEHGHVVGDEVLKEFSKTINENCRFTDFLARWGGEEFLLVCPNTTLSDAYQLAQTLRSIISEKVWINDIRLTSSFGVAQRGNESAREFIERADKALYDAKARGRNQVVRSE